MDSNRSYTWRYITYTLNSVCSYILFYYVTASVTIFWMLQYALSVLTLLWRADIYREPSMWPTCSGMLRLTIVHYTHTRSTSPILCSTPTIHTHGRKDINILHTFRRERHHTLKSEYPQSHQLNHHLPIHLDHPLSNPHINIRSINTQSIRSGCPGNKSNNRNTSSNNYQ